MKQNQFIGRYLEQIRIVFKILPEFFALLKTSSEYSQNFQIQLGTYRNFSLLKFIYSEKATKFCEIFTLLFDWHYIGQK